MLPGRECRSCTETTYTSNIVQSWMTPSPRDGIGVNRLRQSMVRVKKTEEGLEALDSNPVCPHVTYDVSLTRPTTRSLS